MELLKPLCQTLSNPLDEPFEVSEALASAHEPWLAIYSKLHKACKLIPRDTSKKVGLSAEMIYKYAIINNKTWEESVEIILDNGVDYAKLRIGGAKQIEKTNSK